MRKTWSALRCSIGRMLSWKTIVFTVLSAALYVTLLPYVHQEGASIEEVLLTLVGGFEYEEIIAFKLDELFVWTLLLMSYLRCVSIAMQEEYDGRCKDTLYRFSSYQSWYMNQAIAASVACAGITLLIVIGAVTGALLWGRGQFGAIMATMEGFYAPAWAALSHCSGVIALQCTHADAMANAGSFSDRTCGYGSSSLSLAHRCFALCLFQCLPPSNQRAV